MAAIFGKRKIFLRIEPSILHIYPMGQKFSQNRSISHGLGDTSNFKFFVKNSKWLPFLDRDRANFEKCTEYLA